MIKCIEFRHEDLAKMGQIKDAHDLAFVMSSIYPLLCGENVEGLEENKNRDLIIEIVKNSKLVNIPVEDIYDLRGVI